MKGIVFNLLEDVVIRSHGEDVWDCLIDRAGVTGSYTSLGNYADEEIVSLVGAASDVLGRSPNEVLKWFGREAMLELSKRFPVFFDAHQDARSFVLSVNSIIHPEVRKLYVGATCPHFHFKESEDGLLSMAYRSPRKLCYLAEGFVEGASAHYGEVVKFEHHKCMHEGDDHCVFHMSWSQERRIACTAA